MDDSEEFTDFQQNTTNPLDQAVVQDDEEFADFKETEGDDDDVDTQKKKKKHVPTAVENYDFFDEVKPKIEVAPVATVSELVPPELKDPVKPPMAEIEEGLIDLLEINREEMDASRISKQGDPEPKDTTDDLFEEFVEDPTEPDTKRVEEEQMTPLSFSKINTPSAGQQSTGFDLHSLDQPIEVPKHEPAKDVSLLGLLDNSIRKDEIDNSIRLDAKQDGGGLKLIEIMNNSSPLEEARIEGESQIADGIQSENDKRPPSLNIMDSSANKAHNSSHILEDLDTDSPVGKASKVKQTCQPQLEAAEEISLEGNMINILPVVTHNLPEEPKGETPRPGARTLEHVDDLFAEYMNKPEGGLQNNPQPDEDLFDDFKEDHPDNPLKQQDSPIPSVGKSDGNLTPLDTTESFKAFASWTHGENPNTVTSNLNIITASVEMSSPMAKAPSLHLSTVENTHTDPFEGVGHGHLNLPSEGEIAARQVSSLHSSMNASANTSALKSDHHSLHSLHPHHQQVHPKLDEPIHLPSIPAQPVHPFPGGVDEFDDTLQGRDPFHPHTRQEGGGVVSAPSSQPPVNVDVGDIKVEGEAKDDEDLFDDFQENESKEPGIRGVEAKEESEIKPHEEVHVKPAIQQTEPKEVSQPRVVDIQVEEEDDLFDDFAENTDVAPPQTQKEPHTPANHGTHPIDESPSPKHHINPNHYNPDEFPEPTQKPQQEEDEDLFGEEQETPTPPPEVAEEPKPHQRQVLFDANQFGPMSDLLDQLITLQPTSSANDPQTRSNRSNSQSAAQSSPSVLTLPSLNPVPEHFSILSSLIASLQDSSFVPSPEDKFNYTLHRKVLLAHWQDSVFNSGQYLESGSKEESSGGLGTQQILSNFAVGDMQTINHRISDDKWKRIAEMYLKSLPDYSLNLS